MSWWFSCCPRGCLIFSDTFNRPNNTDLGSNWDETAGDSDIFGETARVPAGGSITCTKQHPLLETSGVVQGVTYDESSSQKWGIRINYFDEDNFHEAVFHVGGPTISLYKVVGGVRNLLITEVLTPLVGTSRTFTACFTDQVFAAIVTGPYLATWFTDSTPIANGIYSGLSNCGIDPIRWDSFKFFEHYITDHDCPRCRCWCDDNLIKKTLTATYFGTGRLDCGNGETVTLEWDNTDDTWKGSKVIGGITFDLIFTCANSEDPTDMHLGYASNCGAMGPGDFNASEGSTCSPLNLVFGPHCVSVADLGCDLCSRLSHPLTNECIWWTVTEAP